MSFSADSESHAWWASLRHEGLLLDEARLRALFPDSPEPLGHWQAERLRRALVSFQASPEETATRTALVTCLFEETLGLGTASGGTWQRGNAVPAELSHRSVTGEKLKPQHLCTHDGSPPLPVFISADTRLGIGRGKRSAARVLEWMRATRHRLAVLTNGHQWRIIYAHADTAAWCESDSSQWFLEGRPAPQLDALRLLLAPRVLIAQTPDPEKPANPLISAIEASRRGQSELSAILGERVRVAVEKLIASHGPAFLAMDDAPPRQDIYVAACRVVLRQVFTLFAEARDLLDRGNPVYWHSYSLGGLLDQLLRVGAGAARERLRHRFSAWPRLVALGRLIHAGSPHEALPMLPYGGELFAPGDPDSTDGISRALAVFETACFDSRHRIMADAEVLEMLALLTRTQAVIRQGRGRIKVTVPVNFSDLTSEYIGILYEGLLDYELRCVSEEEAAVIFLALGNEPALPLSRLESLDDDALTDLINAFKKANKGPAAEESDGGEEDAEDDAAQESEEEEDPSDPSDPTDPADLSSEEDAPEELADEEPGSETTTSLREDARRRAVAWATRAVEAGGLVPKPRGRASKAATEERTRRVEAMAKALVRRLVLPGEWYLVRWGGTRKGSGSFYTRPGLATPTIRRTLEPLAYDRDARGTLVPRAPESILALKTCDPACGSGTFPVGAARYLTEALFQSVFHHHWLEFSTVPEAGGTTREVLKLGAAAIRSPEGTIPPVLDALIKEVRLGAVADESRLRAWLKRAVVESCIYGVDIDPLAIELARLSLWVETMDPSLPFTFLDHKLRCGNGLVGAWLDTFQHYPVMAWLREGGDKNHTNFHHHYREKELTRGKRKGQVDRVGDVWTNAIKDHLDNVIRPSLHSYIEETTSPVFALISDLYEPDHLLDQAFEAFSAIHAHVHNPAAQRAAFEKWLASPHYRNLRTALDLWCALWFWPADQLDAAPTPQQFAQPAEEAIAIARRLRETHRFLHWELEFPDVFGTGTREQPAGFHAILGNPPWEIQKPNSKEWFSNEDPLYRSYGKQVALRKQVELFAATRSVETRWLDYNARLKALSHFTKHAAFASGDPEAHDNDAFHFTIVPRRAAASARLHARWRPKRTSLACFAAPDHPFRHQGSADINTYKLFAEQAHALLRQSGRLGFIVPSGLYSDKGSASLRLLFLDHCRWEWCFGFENREGIFDIHRSFKFIALLVQKGGSTDAIRTAFMRRSLDDWDQAESVALDYERDLVTKLSPFSTALVEIRDPRDIAILDRMYSNGVLLGDKSERGWGLEYGTEFHMTNDSKLFPPLPSWERKGYAPDEYGHWLKGGWRPIADHGLPADLPTRPSHARASTVTGREGLILSRDGTQAVRIEDIEDVAVPLYEGRMIGQFDFSQKGWVSGKNRSAVWRDIAWDEKSIEPQYLMPFETYWKNGHRGPKIPFMPIGSSTNSRTGTSTYLSNFPCGNSIAFYQPTDAASPEATCLRLSSLLSSIAYDFPLRQRLAGLNLNDFVMSETILYRKSDADISELHRTALASRLMLTHWVFAPEWQRLRSAGSIGHARLIWAHTAGERSRCRAILEALHAHAFDFSVDHYRWLIRDCDHPAAVIRRDDFTSSLDPKGFWRVDKEKDPELRHTVLAQVAFADLQEQGLDAFLAGPDGDGWQLPETLRLADYGLGHDDRAREPQPVASRLGPRFLDWQLEKDPAQSWAECDAHAAQLDALWRHARSLAGIPEEEDAPEPMRLAAEEPATYTTKRNRRKDADDDQLGLFQ